MREDKRLTDLFDSLWKRF